jgi:hypothetical protein
MLEPEGVQRYMRRPASGIGDGFQAMPHHSTRKVLNVKGSSPVGVGEVAAKQTHDGGKAHDHHMNRREKATRCIE